MALSPKKTPSPPEPSSGLRVSFRKAVARDFPSMQALHDQAFGMIEGVDLPVIHSYIRDAIDNSYVFSPLVAVNDDESIIGFSLARHTPSKLSNLDILVVHQDYRGKKIGSQLLSETEKKCLEKGCRQLSLQVRSCDSLAIRFYEANQYKEVDAHTAYYPDGVAALEMAKKLKEKPSCLQKARSLVRRLF